MFGAIVMAPILFYIFLHENAWIFYFFFCHYSWDCHQKCNWTSWLANLISKTYTPSSKLNDDAQGLLLHCLWQRIQRHIRFEAIHATHTDSRSYKCISCEKSHSEAHWNRIVWKCKAYNTSMRCANRTQRWIHRPPQILIALPILIAIEINLYFCFTFRFSDVRSRRLRSHCKCSTSIWSEG